MVGIDDLFVKVAAGLAVHWGKKQALEALRAIVEQEIETIDMNRLVTQPLKTGCGHLRKAELESGDTATREKYLNYAMLDFSKAADLDAPLPAARAAFYAGMCHQLLGEYRQSVDCYERSFSMLAALESGLMKKLTALTAKASAIPVAAIWLPPVLDILAVGASALYQAGVTVNISKQLKIVQAHKKAVGDFVEAIRHQQTSSPATAQ